MSLLDLVHIKITTEFRSHSQAAWKKEEVETQMLSSFFPEVGNAVSPFPIVVLDWLWSVWEHLLHFKFTSCLNLNELLSVDKTKDMVRMGDEYEVMH